VPPSTPYWHRSSAHPAPHYLTQRLELAGLPPRAACPCAEQTPPPARPCWRPHLHFSAVGDRTAPQECRSTHSLPRHQKKELKILGCHSERVQHSHVLRLDFSVRYTPSFKTRLGLKGDRCRYGKRPNTPPLRLRLAATRHMVRECPNEKPNPTHSPVEAGQRVELVGSGLLSSVSWLQSPCHSCQVQ
jgi:hypothetical protein